MGAYKYIQGVMEKEAVCCVGLSSEGPLLAVLPVSTLHRDPRPTQPDKTQRLRYRLSKFISFARFMSAVVVTNSELLRVQLMASVSTMVSTSYNLPEAFSLFQRRELDAILGL